MYDAIRASLPTAEFVALWSGLSIGTIAGLGALFYFVPLARKLAVQVAIIVIVAWSCLMHGHIRGVADEDSKLQTLSDSDDKSAAKQAAKDEKARADAIEAKAKDQHATDLAEISRLGAGCSFDPGVDGVQPSGGDAPTGAAVNHKPKPAAVAKAALKSGAGAATRQGLRFPVVWPSWLQGKKPGGDASADGK